MSKSIALVFPHQLFEKSVLLEQCDTFYIIEEYLLFRQYTFHKQKLAFHIASMSYYKELLIERQKTVRYISHSDPRSDIRVFLNEISQDQKVELIDPIDDWLLKRIRELIPEDRLIVHESPQFLNSSKDLEHFFRPDKKSFFQTTFYKQERKKRNVLLDSEGQPLGGKWTFDSENRKKYPKGKTPPAIQFPSNSFYWKNAVARVREEFPENPGSLEEQCIYPTTHADALELLDQFFENRFHQFGPYEDAILKHEIFLNHSLLSPLLNSGLLLPQKVLDLGLAYAKAHQVPINSTEGFVRQIIGWREFIHGMYKVKGSYTRTRNFWGFKRKIPSSFYDGSTGIAPVDDSIKKVLQTGYCHHIERLMVLGNFMLLCEFDPDDVYRWFMELFIDAYDWVMVPNVYGMALFADGGTFATKPYIGGSNYIKKMSDYKDGEWAAIWDGLFWRFIDRQKDFFKSNPRLGLMVNSLDKMPDQKRNQHFENAEVFLKSL